MTTKMNHYYSNDWCKDERARTQEELQNIASLIRKTCKTQDIQISDDYVCTTYTNEALGIRYWIKDTFGTISEIDEARNY